MDVMSGTRFVTPAEKAEAARQLREAYRAGLIGADDLSRRLFDVERSEDLAQLTAARGERMALVAQGAQSETADERPSPLLEALPHVLGALTTWVGPGLMWAFVSNKAIKRQAKQAFFFQLIGVALVVVLRVVIGDWISGLAELAVAAIGVIAAVRVATGNAWSYRFWDRSRG